MKRLITASVIALLLTGCALPPKPATVAIKSQKVNADAEPEALYYAAQLCVLDNVNPPLMGQLFTYQSDKNSSLAFVYSDKFTSSGYTFPFRATIRFNGKTGVFKPQGVSDKSGQVNPAYGAYYDDAYTKVNLMVNRLSECVPTYL